MQISYLQRFLFLLLVTVGVLSVYAARKPIPPEAKLPETAKTEFREAMASAAKSPHPRLFATAEDFAELRRRASSPGLTRQAADWVRASADLLLRTQPIRREKIGRRLLQVSRRALLRLTTLGMAWQLSGRPEHLNRAIAEINAACDFADWNPSHFLDVAEMTLALSIGYDWLYEGLDPETRQKVARTIRRMGLDAGRRYQWWVTTNNNWGQVCHAGLLAGALATAEVDPADSARFLQRAVACLPFSMRSLAPNGNYPEGPGYWTYGVEFNVVAIALMEKAFGTSFGLDSLPGFRETACYLDLVTGPSGDTFNYADGGSKRVAGMAAWWFAKHLQRPDLLSYFEHDAFTKLIRQKKINPRKNGDRLLPLSLLWLQEMPEGTRPLAPLVWDSQGMTPITIQRSSWDNDKALFVGLKGGSPSANHGHMDGGAFVFESKGIRWGLDLGAENYNKIEQRGMNLWNMSQHSDRWKIFRLNALSHNILMLDACPQFVQGFAKVTQVKRGEGCESEVTMDLSSLYTNATSVIRSGKMNPEGTSYLLHDMVRGLRPGAPVRWSMMIRAAATTNGLSLQLTSGDKHLSITQCGKKTAPWEVRSGNGPNPWDGANKNARQIVFTIPADSEGSAEIIVRFE